MELTCPNCAARFRAPDDAFVAGPRKVRCGRCKHVWMADAPPAAQPPAPLPAAPSPAAPSPAAASPAAQLPTAQTPPPSQPAAPPPAAPPSASEEVYADYPSPVARDFGGGQTRGSNDWIDSTAAPAPAPVYPEPVRSPAGPPSAGSPPAARPESAGFPRYDEDEHVRGNQKRSANGLVIGWILFFLVVAGILAGGWHFRDQVVERVPQLQRVYELIDAQLAPAESAGLELRGVTSVLRTIGGERRMVIEGSVVNVSESAQEVPLLRAVILDENGQAISEWDFDPGVESLQPGARVEFSTSTSAPEGESQLDLVFVPR